MNTGNAKLDARSEANLQGVDPTLVTLFRYVAQHTDIAFIITEGLRTPQRQAELVKAGASRTLKSKHLTGEAVDVAIVVGKEVRWDWQLYRNFADVVKTMAMNLQIGITWGGDWSSFKDGPHFELKG